MQRDYSFDYLKGFLIFLVVLGHCPAFLLYKDINMVYNDPLFVFIYSFHMPLFVFVSGYFFAKKKNANLKELVPKQFKRLLYPQFAWNIICLIIILLQFEKFSYLLVGDTTMQTIKCIYHFLTNQWYLWCIFICGIIVVLAYKTKYPKSILLGLAILMILFNEYLPGVVFQNQQVSRQLLFFVGGMLFHDVSRHELVMKKLFLFSLIAYAMSWGIYLWNGTSFGDLRIVYKALWAIFGAMLFYNIAKIGFRYGIFKSSFVIWGGDSLGIYIMHTVINRYLVQGNLGFVISTGNRAVDYILCIFYSVVLTWICVYIVKAIRKSNILKKYLLGE